MVPIASRICVVALLRGADLHDDGDEARECGACGQKQDRKTAVVMFDRVIANMRCVGAQDRCVGDDEVDGDRDIPGDERLRRPAQIRRQQQQRHQSDGDRGEQADADPQET